jgi:hypothetical protein
MQQQTHYQKGDQIWVQEYQWNTPTRVRPATVLSVVENKKVYSDECYVAIRYEDRTTTNYNYECIPESRIAGRQHQENTSEQLK